MRVLKSYTISGDTYTGLQIPANGQAVATFTTTDSKIFVTRYMMFSATDSRILVNFVVKGRNIFAAPIPLPHIAGTNASNLIPFGIGGPLVFPPNENIRVEFRDYSGSANSVIFSFIGEERPLVSVRK